MGDTLRIRPRALGSIGLFGGLGGAINAWWLSSRGFPVGTLYKENLLATAACGALLAITVIGLSRFFWDKCKFLQWVGFLIAGWVSGWISWIPIEMLYYFQAAAGFKALLALAWPFTSFFEGGINSVNRVRVLYPYLTFGFVGLVYYFFLIIGGKLVARKLAVHLLIGCASGCLGSLIFWMAFKWVNLPMLTDQTHIVVLGTVFTIIHGTIWGSLVGFGVWKSQQSPEASS